MPRSRYPMALLLSALLAVAGCGSERDQIPGDPANTGAGRPDTTTFGTAAEDPAVEVLQGAGYGPTRDTVMPGERERLADTTDLRR
jgi:hypothetical protein